MSVVIREKTSGAILATGEPDRDVVKYEGNWYFAPEAVERGSLAVTDRTYTCPSKGVCHWVDYAGPDGATAREVAWVYADPKPGHEIIKDRYGFYAGSRGATRQD
jgi:uncharacterized protein (DUF427 family)